MEDRIKPHKVAVCDFEIPVDLKLSNWFPVTDMRENYPVLVRFPKSKMIQDDIKGKQCADWLKQRHIKFKWGYERQHVSFLFTNTSDAVLFKITWGGQL